VIDIPAAIFGTITGAGFDIVSCNVAEETGVRFTESCKRITTLVVPADVGVPDITPVPTFSVNPEGSGVAVKVFA